MSPPDLFAWDAAGVPAALTDEMERQQREKEKEKKKRSKAKKKETEEKDREAATRAEAVREEQKEEKTEEARRRRVRLRLLLLYIFTILRYCTSKLDDCYAELAAISPSSAHLSLNTTYSIYLIISTPLPSTAS